MTVYLVDYYDSDLDMSFIIKVFDSYEKALGHIIKCNEQDKKTDCIYENIYTILERKVE
jgi:hypothetical protein